MEDSVAATFEVIDRAPMSTSDTVLDSAHLGSTSAVYDMTSSSSHYPTSPPEETISAAGAGAGAAAGAAADSSNDRARDFQRRRERITRASASAPQDLPMSFAAEYDAPTRSSSTRLEHEYDSRDYRNAYAEHESLLHSYRDDFPDERSSRRYSGDWALPHSSASASTRDRSWDARGGAVKASPSPPQPVHRGAVSRAKLEQKKRASESYRSPKRPMEKAQVMLLMGNSFEQSKQGSGGRGHQDRR